MRSFIIISIHFLFCSFPGTLALSSFSRRGRIAKRSSPPPPPPPPPLSTGEAAALSCTGAAWVAAGAAVFSPEGSQRFVGSTFDLATETFADLVKEPAAGFLELTGPLFILQGGLLLLLAAGPGGAVSLGADRCRLGGSTVFASLASLVALASFGGLGGESVANSGAVGGLVALEAATALLGARVVAAATSSNVRALFLGDARALGKGKLADSSSSSSSTMEEAEGSGGGLSSLLSIASFYRSSTLLGILVGTSFIFSPVNPIGIFDTESAVTHLFRAVCGIYIIFLLAPVENLLWRKAASEEGVGELVNGGGLGDATARALNVATGVASGLLVVDGEVQVQTGKAAFAELVRTDPTNPLVQLVGDVGDVGRSEYNTTAAFSVGILVACFYLYQAAFAAGSSSSSSREAGR